MVAPCQKCGISTEVKPKRSAICKSCWADLCEKMDEYSRKFQEIIDQEEEEELPPLECEASSSTSNTLWFIEDVPIHLEPQITTKECLKCDREFESSSKYNRLCEACKISNHRLRNSLV